MTDLRTRWYLGPTIDGSSLSQHPRPGVRYPALFAHVDPRLRAGGGVWCGALDLAGMDLALVAITWDVDETGLTVFQQENRALRQAPDDQVLDFPSRFDDQLANWPKLAQLRAELGRGKLDRDRPSGTVRSGLRDTARQLLLAQAAGVGDFLRTRDRTVRLRDLPSQARQRLLRRIGRARLSRWRETDTVAAWFTRLLDAGVGRRLVEGGRFSLGREEANLGGGTGPVIGGGGQ